MAEFEAVVCAVAWLVLPIGFALALSHRGERPTWREALPYAALFVAALVIRIVFRTEGLGDLKFDQYPAFDDADEYGQYPHGMAPIVLHYALLRVLPADVRLFVASAILFGALVPPLLAATARALG